MPNSEIVSVSDFKVHCLEYLEHTRTDQTEYIVTKRGEAIAKVIPIQKPKIPFVAGGLAHTIKIHGDILEPLEDWDEIEKEILDNFDATR